MKWISVKDRLPPLYEFVLCLNNRRDDAYSHFCAALEEDSRGCLSWMGANDWEIGLEFEKCTHWMPLPERPKDKDED